MSLCVDLSAAFDIIDHPILIERLKSVIGLSGKALSWFKDYLRDRFQAIIIDDSMSEFFKLIFGVRQGSVLGPILFIIYTSPVFVPAVRQQKRLGLLFQIHSWP